MSWDIFSKSKIQYFLEKLKGKFVQKETGKGLSSNDYTTTDKNKVALIDNTTTSVTGNPISIADLKSAQIALNPVITFEPIQAGSGTPSPSNIRAISGYDKIEVSSAGKNILNLPVSRIKSDNSAVAWSGDNYTWNGITFRLLVDDKGFIYGIGIKGTATANTFIRLVNGSAANGFLGMSVTLSGNTASAYSQGIVLGAWLNGMGDKTDTGNGVTYTYPSSLISNNIAISVLSGSAITNEVIIYPMLRDSSQTDATYEPYHKTTDLSESLGQTVYGLTHEVRTGKARVTRDYKDLGDLTWTYSNDVFATDFVGGIITRAAGEKTRFITDIYEIKAVASSTAYSGENYVAWQGFTSGDKMIIRVRDSRYTSAADFKTAMSGHQLVYEVATPTEIQLTPHEVALSQGYNYISTNGTNISLAYHNGELASLGDVSQLGETVNKGFEVAKGNIIVIKKLWSGLTFTNNTTLELDASETGYEVIGVVGSQFPSTDRTKMLGFHELYIDDATKKVCLNPYTTQTVSNGYARLDVLYKKL